MRLIKILQDRITHSEYQLKRLEEERQNTYDQVCRLDEKVIDYQIDIEEMKVAIQLMEAQK